MNKYPAPTQSCIYHNRTLPCGGFGLQLTKCDGMIIAQALADYVDKSINYYNLRYRDNFAANRITYLQSKIFNHFLHN